MEEAYEITRENAHKAAVRSKRHDSKVKSSVLQPGDRVLIRNMTPRGGPGKLRNLWEDVVHTVVPQVSRHIPVYELRPEKGKGKSRILHRNLLLPCDHLPVEVETRPRTRKRAVKTSEEVEQGEEKDDDDEYYPVSSQQPFEPLHPLTLNPVSTDEPAKHLQAVENMSSEPENEHELLNQCEQLLDQEENYVEEPVPVPVPDKHSRTSEQEHQRPSREHKPPKIFTYDRLGSPACYNLRTPSHHTHFMVPQTVPAYCH
ncbi:unnamed protein product [Oreochromis niloticus]|nr:unnamed protein product [Mustela putorius furo]